MSLLAAVAASAPAVYAGASVTAPPVPGPATAGSTVIRCTPSDPHSQSVDVCAGRSGFGVPADQLQIRRTTLGDKPGTFSALMHDLGLEADEIVYPQSNRTTVLHRNGSAKAVAKAPAMLPEPATWAMLLLGFGAIGALVRRRFRRSEERFTRRIREIATGEDS